MSTPIDFPALLGAATRRTALPPLLEALGFRPVLEPLPARAFSAWGLAGAPVRRVALAGRAGSLDALLVELGPDGEEGPAALASRVRARNPARLHFYLFADPGYRALTVGAFGLDDVFRHLTIERGRVRPSDLETLQEMAPRNGEVGLELALRHARALDRSRVTHRFFRDFRGRREAVAAAWTGLPASSGRERLQLALLFLSRLTFLYFLQRRGALAGSDRYLVELFGHWNAEPEPGTTFYRARLLPLFFGALNRRPEHRDPAALRLGDLPYLNGGLFEPHALERRWPELDLPDAEVGATFDDLLERYRFTTREPGAGAEGGAAAHGVDPEILGRVFEGLMAPDRRGDTGSFYTPAPVVNRVVREALATYVAGACPGADAGAVVDGAADALPAGSRYRVRRALERVRILDPACGSGAFLLGALQRLVGALAPLSERSEGALRREVVAGSLYGVDLLDDAALLCALRLWLALSASDDRVRPLPNLDRRIRQGDALVDPLDLEELPLAGGGAAWHPLRDPGLRQALRSVGPAARRYLRSVPEERDRLRRHLERTEQRLARRWVDGARQAEADRLRGLRARAGDRDLFGERLPEAVRAQEAAGASRERIRELDEIGRDLEEDGALPFFSFGVHFADASDGFDVVLSNPPWVRAHRWPERVRRLCARYEVCRQPGWARGTELTGAPAGAGAQVDLSLLFLERSIRLLAPGGVLAMLLPAKALRALYGGAARRMLHRELELTLVEDHALDQRSVFQADAFVAVLVGRKRGAAAAAPAPSSHTGDGAAPVRLRLVRRNAEPLDIRTAQRDLPLFPDDPASPWLVAPADVVGVFRRMQAAGPPLGEHPGLRIRRGVMTGANDLLLFSSLQPRIGGLAEVEAEGYARARRNGESRGNARRLAAVVEMDGLRPLVRGADIDAFRFGSHGWIAWCHDGEGEPHHPPPRLAAYLAAHRERLEGRAGWRPGLPLGAIFRLSADTLRPKVAWHDLSDTVRAVALSARVQQHGAGRELVPLNTVYFIPTPDEEDALLLAGLLNSLPFRTFARALAERAKDARFRFFAWTMAALPLPTGWRRGPAALEIRRISGAAHRAQGIASEAQAALDRAAARLYGLTPDELAALARYDAWLRGDR